MMTTPPPTSSWDQPLGIDVPATDPADALSLIRGLHRTKGDPDDVPALLKDTGLTADEWSALASGAVHVRLSRSRLEAIEVAYGCVVPYLTDATLSDRDMLAARLDYAYARRVTEVIAGGARLAGGSPTELSAEDIRLHARLFFIGTGRGVQRPAQPTPPRRRLSRWPWSRP